MGLFLGYTDSALNSVLFYVKTHRLGLRYGKRIVKFQCTITSGVNDVPSRNSRGISVKLLLMKFKIYGIEVSF